jgi:hypothetical protein
VPLHFALIEDEQYRRKRNGHYDAIGTFVVVLRGGRPPPVPTERGVRIFRITLSGSWFTAFTAICSSFVSMISYSSLRGEGP